jgi:hypothetical protein
VCGVVAQAGGNLDANSDADANVNAADEAVHEGKSASTIMNVPELAAFLNRSTRAVTLWISNGWITPVGRIWVRGGHTSQLRWGDVYAMLISRGMPVRLSRKPAEDESVQSITAPVAIQAGIHHATHGPSQADGPSQASMHDRVDWGKLKRDAHAKLVQLIANSPTNVEDQGAAQRWSQAFNHVSNQLAEMEEREREAQERDKRIVNVDDAMRICESLAGRFADAMTSLEAEMVTSVAQRVVSEGLATDIDRLQRTLRVVVGERMTIARIALAADLAAVAEKMAA